MANDFTNDDNCVALWRMENGALATDSKSSNTLSTVTGTPAASTTVYKEGSASFAGDATAYFERTDANLVSGFPYKSGESNKNISICFWVRKNTAATSAAVISKFATVAGGRTFQASMLSDGSFEWAIGWSSGNDLSENIATTATGSDDQWYHVGITWQDSTKAYRIRVWDDNASSLLEDKNGTATNSMYISTTELNVGARSGGGRTINGYIDELVVFSDILTVAEIDAIRGGTYSPAEINLGNPASGTLAGVAPILGLGIKPPGAVRIG